MEPDRSEARNTSRILLYVALALFVVLALALVGSCRESSTDLDRVEPDDAPPVGLVVPAFAKAAPAVALLAQA